jgi:hypothetical protein
MNNLKQKKMDQKEIEQAAKENNAYGYPDFKGEKHDVFNEGFITGANFVNERQPYTAENMQEYLNFVLKIIKECQDLGMSFS